VLSGKTEREQAKLEKIIEKWEERRNKERKRGYRQRRKRGYFSCFFQPNSV
jgi:hypothetical protein